MGAMMTQHISDELFELDNEELAVVSTIMMLLDNTGINAISLCWYIVHQSCSIMSLEQRIELAKRLGYKDNPNALLNFMKSLDGESLANLIRKFSAHYIERIESELETYYRITHPRTRQGAILNADNPQIACVALNWDIEEVDIRYMGKRPATNIIKRFNW